MHGYNATLVWAAANKGALAGREAPAAVTLCPRGSHGGWAVSHAGTGTPETPQDTAGDRTRAGYYADCRIMSTGNVLMK